MIPPNRFFSLLLLFSVLLTACNLPTRSTPTIDVAAASTQAAATVYAAVTETAIASLPTETPSPEPVVETATPTRDPNRTPPALPAAFTSELLKPLDVPESYIADTCQMLKDRWDSKNAAPGTVVMPIMFHSITKGEVTAADQISITDFRRLMNDLKDQGFEAITMKQMVNFMYHNAKIPQRSVLLIVDDRKYREYFDKTFANYYKEWGWKVVNAWISHPETNAELWRQNENLEKEGWVDHQAHGVIHNINMMDSSTDEFLKGELQGSVDAFQLHFNKTPSAIIWPGGGFGLRPVQAARKYGYQLGFTINPRGPIMFNWVPQAKTGDPQRPSFIPEGPAGDPLMTLPRYWDTDARSHLDTVRKISNAAVAYAEANKATELGYYDIVCAPTYGNIPTE